jgi:hypothetical protein
MIRKKTVWIGLGLLFMLIIGCKLKLSEIRPSTEPAIATGFTKEAYLWIQDGVGGEKAVHGRILYNDGDMSDPAPISEEGSQIMEPRLVQKAGGSYITTWRNGVHIQCAFLSRNLSVDGASFEITDSGDYCSNYSYDMAYLFSSRKLFVVWVDHDRETTPTSTCNFYKLMLRIVEDDRSMGTIQEIYFENGQIPRNPRIVAARTDKLMIVWRSDEGSLSEHRIRAKLITSSGVTLSDYTITGLSDYKFTDVVYDPINERFVIVFDRGDGEIYGRFITFGGVLGDEFHILSRSVEVGSGDPFIPISLAFLDNDDTANFLLAFHEYQHTSDHYLSRLKTIFMRGNDRLTLGPIETWGTNSPHTMQGRVCVEGGMINNGEKFVIVYEEGNYRETRWAYDLDESSYKIYREVR